eukprot:tig00000135_g7969.t2
METNGPAIHAYGGHRELVRTPQSASAGQLPRVRPHSTPGHGSTGSLPRYAEVSQITYEQGKEPRAVSPPKTAEGDRSAKLGAGGKPPTPPAVPAAIQAWNPPGQSMFTQAMVEAAVRGSIDSAVSRFAASIFSAGALAAAGPAAGAPLPPAHASMAALDAARSLGASIDRAVASHVESAVERIAQAHREKKDERDELLQALMSRLQALEGGVSKHVTLSERQQTELGLLHGRFAGMQQAMEAAVADLTRSAASTSTSCQGCKALAHEVSELSSALYAMRAEASALRNEMEEMRGMRGKLQAVDSLLVAVAELQNGERDLRGALSEMDARGTAPGPAASSSHELRPAGPAPTSPASARRISLAPDPNLERRLEALEALAEATRAFLNGEPPRPAASVRRPSGMADGPAAPATRAGLARDVASLGARLDALSTQVVVVGAAAESVRNELRRERDGARDRFAALDRRVTGLAERLGASPIAPAANAAAPALSVAPPAGPAPAPEASSDHPPAAVHRKPSTDSVRAERVVGEVIADAAAAAAAAASGAGAGAG